MKPPPRDREAIVPRKLYGFRRCLPAARNNTKHPRPVKPSSDGSGTATPLIRTAQSVARWLQSNRKNPPGPHPKLGPVELPKPVSGNPLAKVGPFGMLSHSVRANV